MSKDAIETPIPVPKEMVNDDAYLVTAVLVAAGEMVAAGQALAELETSKASFVLHSPADGFFFPSFAAGEMVPVGADFGVLRGASSGGPGAPEAETPDAAAVPDGRFSLPAWELLVSRGLDPAVFVGSVHVRRRDVEAFLAGQRPDSGMTGGEAWTASAPRERAVILLGGGGHCRECIDIIEAAGELVVAGIVDTRTPRGGLVGGYRVLGDNSILPHLLADGYGRLVLAYGIAGSPAARGGHFRALLAAGHDFPALVHPQASVSRQARVARGVQIMAGARIGSEAEIGDAAIINTNAVVSHDCRLGTNVHIAPGAVLAGGVQVGDDSVVGMGATVYMRVRIGEGVVVYNGATIFSDVPDGTTVERTWPEEAP